MSIVETTVQLTEKELAAVYELSRYRVGKLERMLGRQVEANVLVGPTPEGVDEQVGIESKLKTMRGLRDKFDAAYRLVRGAG